MGARQQKKRDRACHPPEIAKLAAKIAEMGGRHNSVLLDSCVPEELKDFFGAARVMTSVECGLRQAAADLDVIDLASHRRALLVSSDQGMLAQCKRYQAQHRTCLWGLLILPAGIEIQRRVLDEMYQGRRRILHPHLKRPATWSDVREENLAVLMHKDDVPGVLDLCDCEWQE